MPTAVVCEDEAQPDALLSEVSLWLLMSYQRLIWIIWSFIFKVWCGNRLLISACLKSVCLTVSSPSATLRSLQEMKVNNLTSFSHFHFPSPCSTPISGTGFQCLCIYWDCWRDCQRKMRVYFFSSLSFFFFMCNLLPSETINAHSTSTSRHCFDVYSGNRPLSFSAACRSLCLSLSLLLSIPLYPFLFPSLTLYGYCTIK